MRINRSSPERMMRSRAFGATNLNFIVMSVIAPVRPLSDDGLMALIDNDDAARRLARAIASDISLYNERKINEGIEGDNLFEALSEQIEEGRALYSRRVLPELYERIYYFYDRALVDILVKTKGHIASKLW